ncbi:uncharacterized protein LOC132644539 [Lycium barbarum]|uniref:uncharacterized protein LOC132644539 n=1 Tax=Lycium barbarum TaxID=112863 RepID=UPI00293EEC09|nr:uncharacterized protein LOC132644539 [Lycium barbarum]
MEYLSRSLNELKEDKAFKFHPRCAKLGITHLCFADDLLLFVKGDYTAVTKLHEKFTRFSKASALQANLAKSAIYMGGVDPTESTRITQFLGYATGELPFKYLGVPLTSKKLNLSQWQPLIEKVVAKISSWTAKKLSYESIVQLVKTVIFGVQSYWAQLFILLAKVMKAINAYCRSFIWSRINTITKRALVSWDRVCLPKSVGGMNLTYLKTWNKAAITKACKLDGQENYRRKEWTCAYADKQDRY